MATQSYEHPFCIAIENKNVEIAAIILGYSRRRAKYLSLVEDSPVTEVHTSAEWMHPFNPNKYIFRGGPVNTQVIMHAVQKLPDDDLCRLFMIAGPEDINANYQIDPTLLHRPIYQNGTILNQAVFYEKDKLARLLVEIYGANIGVRDENGKTALDYARERDTLLASKLEKLSEIRSSKSR